MQDLRLALRTLRATPIVTSVAVLSLALGIGANTAIFSLVNSLLLRSLPVADPQRLVSVSTGRAADFEPSFSYATFDQIRQHGQAFDGALAYRQRSPAQQSSLPRSAACPAGCPRTAHPASIRRKCSGTASH